MAMVKEPETIQHLHSFNDYPAAKKLQKLAEQPIDLTQPHQLTPERLTKYCAEACGYKLLYGTERITDEVMHALSDLAKEAHAIERMEAMQDGAIVNLIENFPSEHRPALHTAVRDLFDHPRTAPKAKEAAHLAKQEIEKLKAFIAKIDKEKKYNELITIGIGGSDLGPRATYHALEFLLKPGRKIHFISNVDPDDVARVIKNADLKHALVVVISKSGTTLETGINEDLVREKFKEQGIDPKNHFISVTMPGTPMDDKKRYLETFHLWDWIGGRYSVTSMVGGVMLAFAFGFDVFSEFLRGAHAMDRASLQPDLKHNLPLLAALLSIWNHNFLNYSTIALIPYSQALIRYPAHIQQVEMESNGKCIDQRGNRVNFQTGPIIWGEPGTNGQHSFFQLLHQGTATVPVMMIGYKKSQYHVDIEVGGTTSQEKLLANMLAQSLALAMGQRSDNPNQFFPGNRPSNILLAEELTPFSLGVLLSLFENMVAFQGFIWGINSFDQEGVQLGKVLATKIINRFAAKRNKAGDKAAAYPLADAYLRHFDHF
ncbi:MAG: glucose-6-phosphate isomerase [Chlamydiales bacterium]